MPIGRYPPSSLFPLFYILLLFLCLIYLPNPSIKNIIVFYIFDGKEGLVRKGKKTKKKKAENQNNKLINKIKRTRIILFIILFIFLPFSSSCSVSFPFPSSFFPLVGFVEPKMKRQAKTHQ